MRNVSAAIDLARDMFPSVEKILLSGTSAGGFGVAGVAPFIVRFAWKNEASLYVFHDSGPAIHNLADPATIQTRVRDWASTQFYPSTCTDCTPDRQPAELVEWMLEHDDQVRRALYTTDADAIIRFFLSLPTQPEYRDLLLGAYDPIHAAFPDRFERFVRSESEQHAALVNFLIYTAELDGVPLYRWTRDFVDEDPGWVDLVQDLILVP